MVLVFLFTCAGLLAAAALTLYALVVGKISLAKAVGATALVCAGLYLGGLLLVSFSSPEVVLGRNEEKRFGGFVFDPHLLASVVGVSQVKATGQWPDQATAGGVYMVVTVRLRSDARRVTLTPRYLVATVVDAEGRRYDRSLAAEAALSQGREIPLAQPIGPGDYYTKDLVFDLPPDASHPRLLIGFEHPVNRLLSLFIIGDEDSLFHEKVKFRLEPAPAPALAPQG